jgi:predicted DNA-binding transcriptional regulator
MRKVKTNEEKTAEKIIDALNDYTLWEKLVGYYLFELSPPEIFDKIEVVTTEAIKARDKEIDRQQQPKRKLDPPF